MGQHHFFLFPEKDALSGPRGITTTQDGAERCAGAVQFSQGLSGHGQEGSCSSECHRKPLNFEEGKRHHLMYILR